MCPHPGHVYDDDDGPKTQRTSFAASSPIWSACRADLWARTSVATDSQNLSTGLVLRLCESALIEVGQLPSRSCDTGVPSLLNPMPCSVGAVAATGLVILSLYWM
jgi:hypothetical protein